MCSLLSRELDTYMVDSRESSLSREFVYGR